jgi:hypothetical protein
MKFSLSSLVVLLAALALPIVFALVGDGSAVSAGAPCNAAAYAGPINSADMSVNLSPHSDATHQPVGGQFLFDLTRASPADANRTTLAACLTLAGGRQAVWTPLRIVKADGATTTFGADEILRLPAPANAGEAIWSLTGEKGALLVIALDDSGKVVWRRSIPIVVSSRLTAGVAAGLFLVFVLLALLQVANVHKIKGAVHMKLIANGNGYASLSKLQILAWTLLIGAGSVYVMTLTDHLLEIPAQTLGLLGIAGGGLLGSDLAAVTKGTLANKPLDNPQKAAEGPRFRDLVVWDGQKHIDVTRVQILIFTLIALAFVGRQIFAVNAIPEVPTGLMTLMGLSNGLYLTRKFLPPPEAKDGDPTVDASAQSPKTPPTTPAPTGSASG